MENTERSPESSVFAWLFIISHTIREDVQAKLRVMVKRILRKHGYPPDKQKKATDTVLEQANTIARDWAEQ